MPWQAIQYVSTGFTLCAFIVAAIAWAYKQYLRNKQVRIESAAESDRAELISQTLEVFKVDTASLTKDQQYKIALAQIKARAERFRIIAIVVVTLAILGTGLSAYAIQKTSQEKLANSSAVSGTSLAEVSFPYPPNFTGRIFEVYENALTKEERTRLGHFAKDSFLGGGAPDWDGPSFVRFEHGVAIHFKGLQESKSTSSGGRGFFIHVKTEQPDVVVEWSLVTYPAETDPCFKKSRWALPKDRCKIFTRCREPNSGFGAVWCRWPTVKTALGVARTCETWFRTQIQAFEHGYLIVDVPNLDPAGCQAEAAKTYVDSFVLFSDPQSSIFWNKDGRVVVMHQLADLYGPSRWPIWTCTARGQGCAG